MLAVAHEEGRMRVGTRAGEEKRRRGTSRRMNITGATRIYEIAISATGFIVPGAIYPATPARKLIPFLIPSDFLSADNSKDPLRNLISKCILEKEKKETRRKCMYIYIYVH